MYAHVICICYTNEVKLSRNVVQTYLSGIFTHNKGSIAIISDNGKELTNAVLTDTCEQLGIKRLYPNPFHVQGNSRIENVHKLFNPFIMLVPIMDKI